MKTQPNKALQLATKALCGLATAELGRYVPIPFERSLAQSTKQIKMVGNKP